MWNQMFTQPSATYVFLGIGIALVVLLAVLLRTRKSGGGISGADLGDCIRQLRATHAQWPVIMATLNPRNRSNITQLLKELQGPHMFVPQTALNIIEDAYSATARGNPGANVREVLQNACISMRKVTRYGD